MSLLWRVSRLHFHFISHQTFPYHFSPIFCRLSLSHFSFHHKNGQKSLTNRKLFYVIVCCTNFLKSKIKVHFSSKGSGLDPTTGRWDLYVFLHTDSCYFRVSICYLNDRRSSNSSRASVWSSRCVSLLRNYTQVNCRRETATEKPRVR